MDTTLSNLTTRIATLSPAKRALLELKLKQQEVIRRAENTIPRRVTQEAPPLSFAQQRLWFLDQLEPESAVYNIPGVLRLRGILHIPALEQSLNEIVRRHEALRTTFAIQDGVPVQIISPSLTLILPVVDVTDRAESIREAEAQRLVKEEAHQPFDLIQGPLLRAKVLRLGDQEHIFVLTFHHIVFDGWSLGVLYRELSVLYHAFSHDQPSPLPELPLQYADYAIWQREWLQGEVLTSQLSYWKQQLADLPAVLNLPTDRPRPAQQTFHGAQQSLTLPQSLVADLKKVSRQGGVTLNMTMLAALQALLYRYTSQDTIVVGSPIAGRRHRETEEIIGFFVNTLALKTDLSGNPRFTELLTRVRRVTLEAYYHQDIPFEKVVEEVHPERNLSHSPLFRVMCAFQNVPRTTLDLTGLTVTSLEVGGESAKFDLTLFLVEHEGTLKATVEYNTDLFEQQTVERMLGHYQRLLHGIVENPHHCLSELPILTDAEQQQLLVEWNDTQKDYPREQCVHQLFEAQVEKTPDAVAVVCEDHHLTYRDLNSRANQLAHYLRKQGIGADSLVGLCIERSVEMVIGVLAILKAGGAYVPLDPSYPQERLAFMLADTQAPVLLTQHHLVDALSSHHAQLFCIDRDWSLVRHESAANLPVHTTAENLAYVIYTSGSTGQPKGVEVPHQGIVRLICGSEYAPFAATEVFLQLAPISFDAATFELWGALLHGATCVLFPGRIPSPADLGHVLRKHRVSTLWLTASLFNSLIDHAPEALTSVRWLLTGGEALSVSHVRRALTLLPATQLINGYGPTESTTFACTYAIPRHIEATATSIPIGRPIANTTVYILDSGLAPVPIGVAGELYIGGDGLARGYLNRPELTAEKFIPNPFSSAPGAQLYKTGDLVRYLPDGNIEFLGRMDTQVKIRGFRIEPGEIEAVLAQHPAVREAVIIVREDQVGDKRLVGYVVSQEMEAPSPQTLRTYLQQKLPEYMIPSAFVSLGALPLTLNGKVDRRALPQPEQLGSGFIPEFVAPSTPLEELLAEIWADVLKVDKIGIYDNFFDLGGHSLLATQIVWTLEKRLGKTIPVASMFRTPTIKQLARALSAEQPPSRGEVEARLIRLWEAEFNTDSLTADSDFFELGGDGLRALRLLQNVEQQFGKNLSVATLFAEPTIGQMVNRLCQPDAKAHWSFLLPLRTTGAQPPFFFAGPRILAHYLGPEQPVYGLYLHGLDGRPVPATVEEVANQYLHEIRNVQPEGPYVLGGYSFGGIVAFEMAQQLQRQGQAVAGLFLVDPTPPHGSTGLGSGHRPSFFARFSLRVEPPLVLDAMEPLPRSLSYSRTDRAEQHQRWHRSITRPLKKIICQLYLSAGWLIPLDLREFYALNARLPLIRRYRPQPYAGKVILFKIAERFASSHVDWEHFLTGETEICQISGTHRQIFQSPYFQTWVPQMVNALQRVTKEISPSSHR